MGERTIKIYPRPDPSGVSVTGFGTTPDAYESRTQRDVQRLIRSRHAMPWGTMRGRSSGFKHTEWLLYAEALDRESQPDPLVSLPWKFALCSLQVTDSRKFFTGIISSYFLYCLRAFHCKRHQHFLALGNWNISGSSAVKTCTKAPEEHTCWTMP